MIFCPAFGLRFKPTLLSARAVANMIRWGQIGFCVPSFDLASAFVSNSRRVYTTLGGDSAILFL
jgi:hypothetical protein